MRFSEGEIVFHRLKIDLRPRMLQKSREKVLEEMSRHTRSSAEGQSDLKTFVVPPQIGTPWLGFFIAI